ncbi:MAG: hypothetical protein OK422_06105 [Thaumarchaeota archaeon]|nr:hypothetical protein [Nitrososphaerota archaeon]
MTASTKLVAQVFLLAVLIPTVPAMLSSSARANSVQPGAVQSLDHYSVVQQASSASTDFGTPNFLPTIQPSPAARALPLQSASSSGQPPAATATSAGTTAWAELGPKPIVKPSATPNYYGTAPFSGRITAIAINSSNPQTIYVGGAQGGVWKSTDGGSTWTPLTDSQPSLAIGSISISPDGKTLYVGTGEPNHSGDTYSGAGLLKSSDGGRTWTVLGASIFKGSSIAKVLVGPGNPSRILVSTTWGDCCRGFYRDSNQSAYGIYLSTDEGSTWTPTLASHYTRVSFADLVVNSTNSNIIYASGFNGTVWRSTNSGSSWSVFLHLTSINCLTGTGCRVALATTPTRPGSLFAAFSNNHGNLYGIYRDDLSTNQVVPLNNPPIPPNTVDPCNKQCDYDLLMAADPSTPNVLYFGGVDLFISTDGGTTWTDLGGFASGGIHPDQHALAFLPTTSDTIFSGNDGGIWKSTNRGTTWVNLNSGLGLTQFESITGEPSSLLFGGTQDNGCVQYAGTPSWSLVQGGDGGWTGFEQSNPNIMYCNFTHLTFQKSTDGGKTWQNAISGLNQSDNSAFFAPVAQDPHTPGTLYMGGTHVHKTADFAASWSDVSGSLGSSLITALVVAPSSSNTVYQGDESGNVKVSTNGGSTWQLVGTTSGYAISGLAVDHANANLVYVSAAFQNTLHEFALQSGTWQETNLAATPDRINVVRVDASDTLYVGTDHGVYYSTDSGATWSSPGTGLPNIAVFDLEITSANLLIAATHGRGVWIVTPTPPTVTALTASYSVKGGGSGYLAPVLTYISGGVQKTATLSTQPVLFTVDIGSSWSINHPLAGSSSTERWETNLAASGTAQSPQTVVLVYYHQFFVSFGYNVAGGGTGYTSPSVGVVQFGSPAVAAASSSAWVDAGSSYSYANPLIGSSSSERWITDSPTGDVGSSGAVAPTFYHQFEFSAGYSVVSGGLPSPPNLVSSQFGRPLQQTLAATLSTYWLDEGASWSLATSLEGSTFQERWVTVQPINGTISQSITIQLSYRHQYYLTLSLAPTSGGSVNGQNGWVEAGSTLKIAATANSGWRFEGWTGSGNGSSSDMENSTSIVFSGPIAEKAVFFPGLTIVADNGGSVSYTAGTTGPTGVVRGGASSSVYAPPGTMATLTENPSSLLYEFIGWSNGATGTSSETSLTLNAPLTIEANFSYNYRTIGGIIAAIAVVVVVAVLLRRRSAEPLQKAGA